MRAWTLPSQSPAPEATPNGPALDATQRWAICCSGGGIRSACYCLGAMQRLGQDFLDKTRVIVSVSGGSYIAASRALVAHGLREDGLGPGACPPAYAPGTPEEQHFRDNARYIAPDAKTVLAGVLWLLFGVAVTLLLFLVPVFAVTHMWGWILRSTGTLTYTGEASPGGPHEMASVTAVTWFIVPVIAAAVTLVIFAWFWATLVPDSRLREVRSQKLIKALGWAAFITLLLAVAMLAVPELIAWLSGPHSGSLMTVLDDLGFGVGAAWSPAAIAGFVMAIVAVSQSAHRGLARFDLLKAQKETQAESAPAPGLAATVTLYVRMLLLPWLASTLIVLAGFAAALRWVKDGAAAGFSAGQVWLVIGALAVMLAARFVTDANRISLHDIYRWRLTTAYAVTRKTTPKDGNPAPFGTKDAPGVRLSELSGDQPELVLCSTANINADREVPTGRGAFSFTFDARHVTLRGSDPDHPLQADTADYEALVGPRRLTLFDVSALSGAAFSPLMGAATRQAHRILFTATDLRLGLWLAHPALVKAARQEITDQDDQGKPGHRPDHWWHWLGLFGWYVLPHPRWRREDKRRERRETRLWAYVLRLRSAEKRWPVRFGGLLYRALQPTLGMLYAEAAGHTSYRSTWMCVTDGGHYDNLGLVEALQRREEVDITHILVLDASGDQANTFYTLGGAIALARSDAAAEVRIEPTDMIHPLEAGMSALAPGQVVRPYAAGTAKTPGCVSPSPLVVCKLGWWAAAPWDVCAYAAKHRDYPTDSTLDQLYDATEFDAYRQLGWSAVDAAIAKGEFPPGGTSRQLQAAANLVG